MDHRGAVSPALSEVRPVLLCLPGPDPFPFSLAESALDRDFLVVRARDPSAAAELARSCRPDLLLGRARPDGRPTPPLDPCRTGAVPWRLPVVLVQAAAGLHMDPAPVGSDVSDVLPADLAAGEARIRLRAVLRRERPAALKDRRRWNGLELRHDQRTVLVAGEVAHLSFQQFNLLALLLDEPGRAWTRGELQRGVWGLRTENGPKALNRQVQLVRQALAPRLGYDPIEPLRGLGYRMR